MEDELEGELPDWIVLILLLIFLVGAGFVLFADGSVFGLF